MFGQILNKIHQFTDSRQIFLRELSRFDCRRGRKFHDVCTQFGSGLGMPEQTIDIRVVIMCYYDRSNTCSGDAYLLLTHRMDHQRIRQ